MGKGKYNDIKGRFKEIKYLLEIEGYNEKQLIEHLGIHKSTFYDWKKNKPDFTDLLKNSKKALVSELKETALKVAKGYFETETTTETKEFEGKTVTTVKKVKKYYAPDKTILIFMLSNLDPKNFRRKDKEYKDDSESSTKKPIMTNIKDLEAMLDED